MRISDWSSDVCSSDLAPIKQGRIAKQCPPLHLLAQSRGFQLCGPQHCGLWPRGNRQMQGHARRATVTALGQEILGTAGQCAWIQWRAGVGQRSAEHTSELQSLMRISYAVFCLK